MRDPLRAIMVIDHRSAITARPPQWALLIVKAALAACAMGQPHAEPADSVGPRIDSRGTPRGIRIPGTEYDVKFGPVHAATQRSTQPAPALLKAIVTWLANNFGLPRNFAYPTIRFESAARIATFHYTGLLSDRLEDRALVPPGQREIVADYDPLTDTILLPDSWTGGTPAELSILVHEMVHHVQHMAHLQYECVQASEELAYAAQEKWLEMFGRSLATDFQIDGLTLLVSTKCMP